MTLYKKTKEIALDSIKSAIFIDENALDFYQKRPQVNLAEFDLSINLFNKFKAKGISLSVHKFKSQDINDSNTLNYLLQKRDLILLDWKLDGQDGEDYSLELLSKIVKEKHIHFCSIFTSENDFDDIINNIESYFSGFDKQYYDNIVDKIDAYNDKADPDSPFRKIDIYDAVKNSKLFNDFRDIDNPLPNLIKQETGISDFGRALIQVKHAFSNFHKSNTINPLPTYINKLNFSLNINNTIITIISKDENSATKILNKLTSQLYNSENCFIQLLGLDMQNSFSKNSSFIDQNLLNSKIDTLMFHRKQLSSGGLSIEFNNFIKSILLGHAKMTLEDSDLKILESAFLDKITKTKLKVSDGEISLINTFYNGAFLKDKTHLNFGDIYLNGGNYYLCITALCDCLHPSNIKNNFYFVKGNKSTSLSKSIATGDGGFKSFIDDETCIEWTNGEYIKPFQLYVGNTAIVNQNISALQIKNAALDTLTLKYVFSLKHSYAQRIANHAFGHPLRVGVDFVKK